ncbi:MAG: acyloxyacyl hydrolase [Bacteroidia bacterium]
MNLKLRILTYLAVLIFGSAQGGISDSIAIPGSWSAGFQLNSGFMMAHRPSVVYLQEGHAFAAEFFVYRTIGPTQEWGHLYNFPMAGLAYRVIDFGNKDKIGLAHCLYPHLLFPLMHHHRLSLLARLGAGIGYVQKPFDVTSNYKNLTIGSHFNAAVLFGLQTRFFTSRRSQLTLGIDFFHLSNGATRVPNLGINMPSVNLGFVYFGGSSIHGHRVLPEKKPRQHEPGLYYAIGFNEKYPPGGPTYCIQVVNGFYQTTIGRKGLLGAGFDYIYDTSIPPALSEEGKSGNYFADASRAGLYGSAGLRLSKTDLLFQTGIYLHNNDKSDGDLYSRLGIRYHLNHHLFAGVHLKAHYGKADYAEWAIGYTF